MAEPFRAVRVLGAAGLVLLTACAGPAGPAGSPPTSVPVSVPASVPGTEVPSPTLEVSPTEIGDPGSLNWYGVVETDERGCPVTDPATDEYLKAEPSVIGADSLPEGLCLYDSKLYDSFAILPVEASADFPQQVKGWLEPLGWSFFEAEPGPFYYSSVNKAPQDVQDLYEFDGSIDGAVVAVESISAEDLESRGALSLLNDTFDPIEAGDPLYFAAIWW